MIASQIIADVQKRSNCAGEKCLSILPEVKAQDEQLEKILAVIFGTFAAVAVLVIIVGAINFATAEGNAENISKAKKTIIYALVGLAIALSAETIVLMILGRL